MEHLQKYWKKYNITKRINLASNVPSATLLRMTLNQLDHDITKAILRAERRVRKAEQPPWSPALKQASLLVKYYKLIRQQHLLQNDMSTAIYHTRDQLEVTPIVPSNTKEQQTLLRKAQKALRKIHQDTPKHRTQHLDTLLKKYDLLEDEKLKTIIHQLIKAEATKQCYRKLSWIA